MYNGYFEEGDRCPNCIDGTLIYPPVENCSCHINPPCSACTDRTLICDKCKYEPEEPPFRNVSIVPGFYEREYKPRPLDNRKIDYRCEAHTNFSMRKKGVYPTGTPREEVRKVVDGTFGGRFEYFGDGKFSYIAYTD